MSSQLITEEFEALACRLLEKELPLRWQHTQSVAVYAKKIGSLLCTLEARELLESAAWCHDIGYSSILNKYGFHPIDGSLWLKERGFPEHLYQLVAYHSCSEIEASKRGLSSILNSIPKSTSVVADVLTFSEACFTI